MVDLNEEQKAAIKQRTPVGLLSEQNGLTPTSNLRFLSFTLAQLPILQMDQVVDSVLSRLFEGRFQKSEDPLDLSRIYEIEPSAGGAHLFKLMVYTPISAPNCSVLITNLADGWSSLSYLLSKEHKQFQIQVKSTKTGDEFPQNCFEVWRSGLSTRFIMVMRDSNEWVFFQKGTPESFEDLGNYIIRMKRKRLDRKILLYYLAKAGFDVLNDLFWKSDRPAYYYHELRKK